MLRYALPEYRLPRAVIRSEVELIRRLGVNFQCSVAVGTDITLNDLDNQYNAVFLAIGTWKEAWVYLPGTELKGVIPALLFLEAVAKEEAVRLGRKVAVIGGGNAAIDSARTALRMGADVTVIYRRERKDMPAIREETDAAEEEGAKFLFLATPHRIVGDEEGNVKAIEVVKTRLGEFDASGRRQAGTHGRDPPPGMRHRHPGGGRGRGPGFPARQRPAHQGERHARSGPLHDGNQPQQILRGRRPDQRRSQRQQRHGLRQEGGAQDGSAADGRVSLGQDRPGLLLQQRAARRTQPQPAAQLEELPARERVESFAEP